MCSCVLASALTARDLCESAVREGAMCTSTYSLVIQRQLQIRISSHAEHDCAPTSARSLDIHCHVGERAHQLPDDDQHRVSSNSRRAPSVMLLHTRASFSLTRNSSSVVTSNPVTVEFPIRLTTYPILVDRSRQASAAVPRHKQFAPRSQAWHAGRYT